MKQKKCWECGKQKPIWKSANLIHGPLCKECSYKLKLKAQSEDFPSRLLSVGKPKKSSPIKGISDKRKEQMKEYRKLRDQYMLDHPQCEGQIPYICTGKAVDLHHSAGRTGNLLTDVRYFKALCRECHTYCELHPFEAKELGLSANRLDK